MLNETHDPTLLSWVDSGNASESDFPIQNLPFGVYRPIGSTAGFRVGVAIGECVLDICAVHEAGLLHDLAAAAAAHCRAGDLNALMALSPAHWSALRSSLSRILRTGNRSEPASKALMPIADIELALPVQIGDFTDFFSSVHHARRTGSLVRPEMPLFPNYDWVPIAYHGRASSVQLGDSPVVRPLGQIVSPGENEPRFAPTEKLDYELELGFFYGNAAAKHPRLSLDDAEDHIFGVCLLNDWSARDIQSWEAKPLGPFLAKSFATTISPWIVTWEALAPFRVPWKRDVEAPRPLGYLSSDRNDSFGALDITLNAWIETARMRAANQCAQRICETNASHAFWTVPQMLVHHTSNGCRLRPGDLIGTGTQSGPALEESACLLELTEGGKRHVSLYNGEERLYFEDGDSVTLTGRCQRDSWRSIGFGKCSATVEPSQ